MRRRIAKASLGLLAIVCARPSSATSLHSGDIGIVGACISASSANHPWLEKTLWGLFDQERGWVGAEVLNTDGSRDLGPMQVNSRWASVVASLLHRETRDVYRWLRDDACFNIGVASWIFLSGYRRSGDYWLAVGAYHSPTKWRADSYATGVAMQLRRRYGSRIFEHRTE